MRYIVPRLRGPAATPTYWPTQRWQSSTPEQQGFDSAKLAAGFLGRSSDIVFEYDNIANNDHAMFRLRLESERVLLSAQETAHELGATFEGDLQQS